jgi:hypothetical protein
MPKLTVKLKDWNKSRSELAFFEINGLIISYESDERDIMKASSQLKMTLEGLNVKDPQIVTQPN